MSASLWGLLLDKLNMVPQISCAEDICHRYRALLFKSTRITCLQPHSINLKAPCLLIPELFSMLSTQSLDCPRTGLGQLATVTVGSAS